MNILYMPTRLALANELANKGNDINGHFVNINTADKTAESFSITTFDKAKDTTRYLRIFAYSSTAMAMIILSHNNVPGKQRTMHPASPI